MRGDKGDDPAGDARAPFRSSGFSDFRKEISFPFSQKWIPLFFSDPKITLRKRILIFITVFPAVLYAALFTIYFWSYIETLSPISFWDFEIELFGFRGLKLLGIFCLLFLLLFLPFGLIGESALEDVFIKITRKEAEQSITELRDAIDQLKSKRVGTTVRRGRFKRLGGEDLESVLAECEAEMDFQKADKLARLAVTEAEEISFEHDKIQEEIDEVDTMLKGFDKDGVDVSLSMAKMELAQTALSEGKFEEAWERLASARSIGSKLKEEYVESMKGIDQIKVKIAEFKEKGVNTNELEKILEKAEKEVKK